MIYNKALQLAVIKHNGQYRNNGQPAVIHPIRVSTMVNGERLKTLALLHDIIEDTSVTFYELFDVLCFDMELWLALLALTHRRGERYSDYIDRLSNSQMAKQVKIADITDNLKDSPSEHAVIKYVAALNKLIN